VKRASFERRLRDELHAARPPREAEAERRAWHMVRAAHAERSPVRERHPGRRLALAALGAALLAVLALSPAGAKVGDWIGDVVDPAPEPTSSTLSSLPAKGRLLVVSGSGPWIVQNDGSRRRLGRFRDASWSPGGLYVAAARGRQLVALEPDGDERWVRPAPGRVSVPRWSPDGYRIVYRSGDELWATYGDNERNWLLARHVEATPPAWRPGRPSPGQVVAFSSGARVRIVEVVEGRRVLGTTRPGPVPRELWWTSDGRRLIAVSEREIRIHDARGRLLRRRPLPPRLEAAGSAMDTAGRRLAVAASRANGRSSELLLYRLDRDTPPRQLFAGPGVIEGLTWSIDGRVLALGRPEANQWVILRRRGRGGLLTVSGIVAGIRAKFAGGVAAGIAAPFPRLAGWCYAEPRETRPFSPCSTGAAPTQGVAR
jgi:dipeptidyl aminopeptidase/acylaminoacyl peptidase